MQAQERVEQALAELGVAGEFRRFEQETRTAEDAAEAIGCETGQVVKTLLFMAHGRPTLVLVPGDRVAQPGTLAKLLGVPRKRLKMGTPAEVAEHTGYSVGTVAPVGMPGRHDVVIDRGLARFDKVWVSAGIERAMVCLDIGSLGRALGAQWAEVAAPIEAEGGGAA